MEIVLNISWLLLVLPAVWIWRQRAACADESARFARLRPLLVLGCVLVLLFPVVSATDDLNAMRFEMEESGPSAWVKQSEGDRTSCWLSKSGNLLVQSISSVWGLHNDKVCGRVHLAPLPSVAEANVYEFASRAPPLPFLG